MRRGKQNNLTGIALSVTGFSLFAVGDAAYKFLTPHYSMWLLLFLVSVFVLLIACVFSHWLGGLKKTFQSPHLKLHILRSLIVFAQIVTFLYGLQTLSLADCYALIFASPFIAALLSIPILKETVNPKQWLAILLGFAGVLIILRPGLIPVSPAALSILFSAFLFSLGNIVSRFIGDEEETLLSWTFFPETAIFIGAGLLALPEFTIPAPFHLGLIIFIAVTVMTGSIAMAYAFIHAPAPIVAPFHYTQMLWGVGLGYLIFRDLPDLWTLVGAVVIIASGIWIVRHNKAAVTEMPTTPPPAAPDQP